MLPKVNRTIVLIGLMGAGKSSIGLRLAKKLGMDFHDLDRVIEEKNGCTVAEIFEKSGEAFFRAQEKKICEEVLEQPPHILATGGGAFMNPEIRKMVKEKAISVWLKAELDVLLDRVSRKNTRPLLEQGDKSEILAKLMQERYPIYGQADIVVESHNGPHDTMVKKIIEAISEKNYDKA